MALTVADWDAKIAELFEALGIAATRTGPDSVEYADIQKSITFAQRQRASLAAAEAGTTRRTVAGFRNGA
jgi:5-enolpyruvylshikimate-3-phosphate synthase